MRNHIDAADIEAFAAVGHHLSFKLAAEALNLSSSALSRRIQKLEQQLKTRLLIRTSREVKLTLAGKEFLTRSQDILGDLDELVLAMTGSGLRRASTVTVATIPSIAPILFPQAIVAFQKAYPSTRIRLMDVTTNEVLDAVERGDVDFGVTSFKPDEIDVVYSELRREPFVAIMRHDYPLARKRTIRWSELEKHPVISTWKGAGIRMRLDFELAKENSSVPWKYEVQQIYTALHFAEAGLGVATVPGFFAPYRDLVAIPLSEPRIDADLGTVRSKHRKLGRQAYDFWELLHSTSNARVDQKPGRREYRNRRIPRR